MAATSALAGVLSEQELQALPLPVKGKLEECLQTKKITLDDLAERYEELMVDSGIRLNSASLSRLYHFSSNSIKFKTSIDYLDRRLR